MKSTYQEQKEKGNLPIAIYIDKQKKEQWENFANMHGMNLKGLISTAVDFFIANAGKPHNTESVAISNKDKQEMQEAINILSKKIDDIPSMMAQALQHSIPTNTGIAVQAFVNAHERLEGMFNASKQRVLTADTLKSAIPDITDTELRNTLNELTKSGTIERTNLGWRRKS